MQIFNRLLGSVEQRVRIAIAQQAQATAELERVAHVATQHMRSPAQQIVQLTQNLRDRSQERLSPEDVAELGLIIAHTQEMRDNMEALEDYMDLGLNAQVKSVSLDAVLIAAKRQLQLATAVETTGALPTIIGYPVLLARLFFYLLEQAVSSRDPHRPLRLEVGATQLGDGWRLSFADNGIALEERCENSLIQENIRRIAQLHGGGMDASSNAEGGVTTSITLGATPQTR